jgi:hypothetical protein
LQGALLQVDVTKIIVHEGDEPNAVFDFLDADGLAGKDGREVDLLAVKAEAAVASNRVV